MSWYHRDRTQQTAYIVADTEGNIGPEAGTTYTVEVRKVSDNSLVTSETGIIGTTATIDPLGQDMQVYVDLWSVRDGYASWQKHRIMIDYVWGETRVTEDGETRTTEDGTIRIVEE